MHFHCSANNVPSAPPGIVIEADSAGAAAAEYRRRHNVPEAIPIAVEAVAPLPNGSFSKLKQEPTP